MTAVGQNRMSVACDFKSRKPPTNLPLGTVALVSLRRHWNGEAPENHPFHLEPLSDITVLDRLLCEVSGAFGVVSASLVGTRMGNRRVHRTQDSDRLCWLSFCPMRPSPSYQAP